MSEVDLGSPNNSSTRDSISMLFEVLRKPDLTLQEVEDFSATDTGQAAFSSVNGLSAAVLSSTSICNLIAASHSACDALFTNALLVQALATSKVAMTAVAASEVAMTAAVASELAMTAVLANPSALTLVAASEVAMAAVAASEFAMTAVFANPTALSLLVASEVAMNAVAASEVALTAVIAKSIARKAVWNGGKMAADKLMRESSFARDWLVANVQVTRTMDASARFSLRKRVYVLAVVTPNTREYQDYTRTGEFVGDYRTGKDLQRANVNVNYNERANPFYFENYTDGSSSEESATVYYIEME